MAVSDDVIAGASERTEPRSPLATGWGRILAYGLMVIVIGLFALLNPVATGFATGILLGLTLLLYGVVALSAGMSALSQRARWTEILLGVVALLAGLLVLFNPFSGALSLVWMAGGWLLVSGIFQMAGAVKAVHDRGWRLCQGLLDAVLGALLLFAAPATGLAFLAIAVGISFLFRGTFLIALAIGLRRLGRG